MPNKEKWLALKSIGCVEATRIIGEKESKERRYFIQSIPADAKRFGHAVRNHWAVENNVHWVMDVTFNEDRALQCLGNAAENMSLIRRLALNVLKRNPLKKPIKRKRYVAMMNTKYLAELLSISQNF